ncbi:MAG: methionine ABC transporter permease [Microbacteriaceae bacterium]
MNATWDDLFPKLIQNLNITFYMVSLTLLLAGVLGLVLGVLLNTTRRGGLLQNRTVFAVLNLLINIIRPIPFILLLMALAPLTRLVVGTQIGNEAAIFVMVVGASFSIARIVEQNLVSVDNGVIEAVRACGAGPMRIIMTVIIPEALGPLILGYTFIVIGIVDMSALVGSMGAQGLGNFALVNGFNVFRWDVTFVAVAIIIVLVQGLQFFGNWLSRKVMRA